MTVWVDFIQSSVCPPAEIGLHKSCRESFRRLVDQARLGLIDPERRTSGRTIEPPFGMIDPERKEAFNRGVACGLASRAYLRPVFGKWAFRPDRREEK
jgi:hypothetical protein